MIFLGTDFPVLEFSAANAISLLKSKKLSSIAFPESEVWKG